MYVNVKVERGRTFMCDEAKLRMREFFTHAMPHQDLPFKEKMRRVC